MIQTELDHRLKLVDLTTSLGNDHHKQSHAKKNLILRNLDMFVWTIGFHYPLAHPDFNMFVDQWTSAIESPGIKEIKAY